MIGVQMRREIGGHVLMRDFQRGEIHLRAGAEVPYELVAIAELDQPRCVGLRAPHEWPAGAERGHPHLVGCKLLGIREIIVALGSHGSPLICAGKERVGPRSLFASSAWNFRSIGFAEIPLISKAHISP